MRRLVLLATFLLAACASVEPPAAGASPAQTASPAPTKPIVLWWGAHSGVAERTYLRVATDDAWKALWARHAGGPAETAMRPEVDFARCEVLAIFAGDLRNTAGLTIASIDETEDRVLVRFDRQTKSYQTGPKADAVTPYAILVIPKTAKPIVLEEDVHSLIGAPPKWKERARL